MMKKQFKKALKVMLSTMVAVGMTSSSLMAHMAYPLQGYLIPATPFDNKIMSSGAFTPLDAPIAVHNEASESLFEISRSFRYVSDEGKDYWQTPEETEAKGSGDCEDKSVWLYVQLRKNGYDSARLVIGRYRSIDRGFHVWVSLLNKNGDTLILDPSKQKRIWAVTDFSEKYYKPVYSFDGFNRYRHSA